MFGGLTIVAEVKMKSPFGFVSNRSWEEQFELANRVGDIISIHTDERWGGSFDDLRKARSMTNKPILAKGIHETDDLVDEAVRSGADCVLVVGRIPEVHSDIVWVEPLYLRQLDFIPDTYKVVWNARDITTGKPKGETFEQARDRWPGWLCQASFVKHIDDVEGGANGILVGEGLPDFIKSIE
ncbi:MAG: hypothetical protein KGH94_00705 [Candidatus Micrarchaeota archaeon]|nr:hypothetical protein [Candidatus Micrarchaeota archaeon]